MGKVIVPKNYSDSAGTSSGVELGNLFTQNLRITIGDGNLISVNYELNYGLGTSLNEIHNAGTYYITIEAGNTNARNVRFLSLDITNLPKFLNKTYTTNAGMVFVILRLKLQDGTYIELHKESITPAVSTNNTYGNTINKKYYINLLTREVGTGEINVFGYDYYKAVVPTNWIYYNTTINGPTYNNINLTINTDDDIPVILSNGYLGVSKRYIWDTPPVGTDTSIDADAVQLNITFNPQEFRFLKLNLNNVPSLRYTITLGGNTIIRNKTVYLKLKITNSLTGVSNTITLKSYTIIVPDNFNESATTTIWADGYYFIDLVEGKTINEYKAITSI